MDGNSKYLGLGRINRVGVELDLDRQAMDQAQTQSENNFQTCLSVSNLQRFHRRQRSSATIAQTQHNLINLCGKESR